MAPAKTNATSQAKRKPPPFKPPRPVASTAASTNAGKVSNRVTKVSHKGKASDSSNLKNAAQRATVFISDDEGESDDDKSQTQHDPFEDDDDDNSILGPRDGLTAHPRSDRPRNSDARAETANTGRPVIPQKLLARLLYDSFTDKDTKIGKDALNVFGKYIEIFAREALARAAFEREDEDLAADGAGDGFLQVEDLERLAPQLLLDF